MTSSTGGEGLSNQDNKLVPINVSAAGTIRILLCVLRLFVSRGRPLDIWWGVVSITMTDSRAAGQTVRRTY